MQNFAHYCGEQGNFIGTFLQHGVFKKQIYTFYIDLHLNENYKKKIVITYLIVSHISAISKR